MSFFKLFPTIPYDVFRNGIKSDFVDIYRFATPVKDFLDESMSYKYYEILNGERPDIVSMKLYGAPSFYWTFFLVNDYLHDGLGSWPMSQENLADYMDQQYNGYAITTKPTVLVSGDEWVTRDSIAGKFELGETMHGANSHAFGTLTKKNMDLNQLIVQDCTNEFQNLETISGEKTTHDVQAYRVYPYIDAPYYYYVTDDSEHRLVVNGTHIQGGTPDNETSFVTNRHNLFRMNETRSKIRIVDPAYINKFVESYEVAINK
jgi:hypothetical protein